MSLLSVPAVCRVVVLIANSDGELPSQTAHAKVMHGLLWLILALPESSPFIQQIMAWPSQQVIGLSAGNASFMEADTAASANEATDFLRDMQVADLCEVRAPAGIEAGLVSS